MEIPRIDYNRAVTSPGPHPPVPTLEPSAAPSPVLSRSPSPVPVPPAVSEPPAPSRSVPVSAPTPLQCLFRGTIRASPQTTLHPLMFTSSQVIFLPSHLPTTHPLLHITLLLFWVCFTSARYISRRAVI